MFEIKKYEQYSYCYKIGGKKMTFEELKVGQKASIQKTFTAADVTAFAGISLDVNPIHMSDG